MSDTETATDSRLLVRLQQGLPLCERPFAEVGRDLGISEAAVLDNLRSQFASGRARRFGGIFDSAALGCRTTLCAAAVPYSDLNDLGKRVGTYDAVTHCYSRIPYEDLDEPSRSPFPALWFTLTAPANAFDEVVRSVCAELAPAAVIQVPTLTRYKVGVILDPESKRPCATAGIDTAGGRSFQTAVDLSDPIQKHLVYRLQDDLPLTSTPYADLGIECGCGTARILDILQTWQTSGALRRIALILQHRRVGFRANAMCVWSMADAEVNEAGQALSRLHVVTHCYHRASSPAFPFNLYAMMHSDTWKSARDMFENAQEQLGLQRGRMLCSIRQYCKTSPRYIVDTDA